MYVDPRLYGYLKAEMGDRLGGCKVRDQKQANNLAKVKQSIQGQIAIQELVLAQTKKMVEVLEQCLADKRAALFVVRELEELEQQDVNDHGKMAGLHEAGVKKFGA